jgi:hypothetical protein
MKIPKATRQARKADERREAEQRASDHPFYDAWVKLCCPEGTPERWHHKLAGWIATELFWFSPVAMVLLLMIEGPGGNSPIPSVVCGIGWGVAIPLELHARRIF